MNFRYGKQNLIYSLFYKKNLVFKPICKIKNKKPMPEIIISKSGSKFVNKLVDPSFSTAPILTSPPFTTHGDCFDNAIRKRRIARFAGRYLVSQVGSKVDGSDNSTKYTFAVYEENDHKVLLGESPDYFDETTRDSAFRISLSIDESTPIIDVT